MRYLVWGLRVILFLLLLGFAIKNTAHIDVHYYLGQKWSAPLVLVLLIAFALGAVIGVLASLGHVLKQRRNIEALERRLSEGARKPEREMSAS